MTTKLKPWQQPLVFDGDTNYGTHTKASHDAMVLKSGHPLTWHPVHRHAHFGQSTVATKGNSMIPSNDEGPAVTGRD